MINIHGKNDSSYRYKMPKLELQVRKNNKTYIQNLDKIAIALNRSDTEIIKYFSLTLGVHCNKKDGCINGKYESNFLQNTLQNYIENYVLGKVCGNPETTIKFKTKILIQQCAACGKASEIPVKSKFDNYLTK